jgi:RsiW-degrading membrane proteinase PrsW (M82 family)
MLDLAVRGISCLLPALLFLLCLTWLDSYKLVRLKDLLAIIALGAVAAGGALLLNLGLMDVVTSDPRVFSRYIAPVIEETFKTLLVVHMVRSHRIGFLVDAAICGFAIGAGFALAENIYYLGSLNGAYPIVWLIRGFGTAIIHGGATGICAILSKLLAERRAATGLLVFAPGWALAVVLHSVFNHFMLSPLVSTLLVLFVLPPVFMVVFDRSEAWLRAWLGVGFDADARLLEQLEAGQFGETRVGAYLSSLRDRFPGEVLADLLCYVRLDAELSLRAKGELMMREAGFPTTLEPEIEEKLAEMRYLEKSIGPTGRLALLPLLHPGGRSLWQRQLLRKD